MTASVLRLGLVINPFAGVGGPTGLKGSDGAEIVAEALAKGGELRASQRASRCLQQLKPCADRIRLKVYGGNMGQALAEFEGWCFEQVGQPHSEQTTAADTQAAVAALQASGIDLLLFVGGDGTARDVCTAISPEQPVLGIPSGVKMHSGVFAISPEGAARVVEKMLNSELVDLREQEVRDIDEQAYRQGVVKSRYYGAMWVPEDGQFVQQCKEGGREVEELVLVDIAAELRERLEDDVWYLVGAGTTPAVLMEELGLPNSLLGVDLVCNEQLLAADLSAAELEARLAEYQGEVVAILSITGGQGSLIGRGNQQLTPAILRRIGRDHLWVLASKSKIQALAGRPLLMDSHDPELDQQWVGYIPVITGYRDTILYPLGMISDA